MQAAAQACQLIANPPSRDFLIRKTLGIIGIKIVKNVSDNERVDGNYVIIKHPS